MEKEQAFTIYQSDAAFQNAKNTSFPHIIYVGSAEDLQKAARYDHIGAAFRDNIRLKENFLWCDCVIMDMDNNDSDDPKTWRVPENVAEAFPGVSYYTVFSRNHMRQKGNHSPRPRFHVYFPLRAPIDTEIECGALKEKLRTVFPFDPGAKDSARQLYGVKNPEVLCFPGAFCVDEFIKQMAEPETPKMERAQPSQDKPKNKRKRKALPEKIPEGSRNGTLYNEATKILKRHGDTEEAREQFRDLMSRTDPPIEEREAQTIWKSALGWYQKAVVTASDYVPPEEIDNIEAVRERLEYGSKSVLQTINNWLVVLQNDQRFSGKIQYDDFSDSAFVVGQLPGVHSDSNFRKFNEDSDSSYISWIVERDYGLKQEKQRDHALNIFSRSNSFNFVKRILENLPYEGDGHIRRLLPGFLGAEDSELNAHIMRKFMIGAVARIYQPGCAMDIVPILRGPQGLGKSSFCSALCLDDSLFCDSLKNFDDIKAAGEIMRGVWISEIPELGALHGTSSANRVKAFLSSRNDIYRAAYGKSASEHLRHTCFMGTSNDRFFLNDPSGSRRFFVVETGVNEPALSLWDSGASIYFKRAWAEALHAFRAGEKWVISHEYLTMSERNNEEYTTDFGDWGMIESYIDEKNLDIICLKQIWIEALGRKENMKGSDARRLGALMDVAPGWERMKTPRKFPNPYGSQRGWKRKENYNFTQKPGELPGQWRDAEDISFD